MRNVSNATSSANARMAYDLYQTNNSNPGNRRSDTNRASFPPEQAAPPRAEQSATMTNPTDPSSDPNTRPSATAPTAPPDAQSATTSYPGQQLDLIV